MTKKIIKNLPMPSSKKISLQVSASDTGIRLDKFLQQQLPRYSRSFFRKLIDREQVTIHGRVVKASYPVSEGEQVDLVIPPPEQTEIIPQNIPLDILFDDEAVLVVNKPPGLVVHPGAGVRQGTLVNALMYHCTDLSGVGGRLRPGIVHRLDKNTSGLLVVAKNDEAHLTLSRQFADKSIRREYLALVWKILAEDRGTINTFVNRSKRDRTMFSVAAQGKKAVTHFRVAVRYGFLTLLKVQLETGRTHQIRIHLNHIHHPVFGDPDYHGRLKQLGQLEGQSDRSLAKKLLGIMPRQALHAHRLEFIHPLHDRKMEFQAPLPGDFQQVLNELESERESSGKI